MLPTVEFEKLNPEATEILEKPCSIGELTLEAMGKRLGVIAERIRLIEKCALKNCKRYPILNSFAAFFIAISK